MSRQEGKNYNLDCPICRQAAEIAASTGEHLPMAGHHRCRACSILMGPGHIEAGPGPYCGTYYYVRTHRGGDEEDKEVIQL